MKIDFGHQYITVQKYTGMLTVQTDQNTKKAVLL